MTDSDPRVFFASERTLLAWVRTGIAIIGLGFVVARFGLFIRLLASQQQTFVHSSSTSAILGISFVLLGSASIVGATWQHHRFVSTILTHDLPKGYSKSLSVVLSLLVALLGICLAGYLLET